MVKFHNINAYGEFLKKKNQKLGINFGLERISHTLTTLHNPQNKYKTIHIAGTNGKGSTTTMISSVLQTAGFKVGTYISPKISSYNEMFLINGQQITDEDFVQNFNEIIDFCDNLTSFEILTVLAFYFFYKEKVDYAVIEVGCGGLLDATNVITPVLTVITNISNDHSDILDDIVKHKLGIIKKNTPLITAIQNEEILEKIYHLLPKEKVFVYQKNFHTKGVKTDGDKQVINYQDQNHNFDFELKLLGNYQVINSGVAIKACLEILQKGGGEEVIKRGVLDTTIHYRFEKITLGNKTFILDGAHNLAGIKALKESLIQYFGNKEKTLIIGILKDKDYENMLNEIIDEKDSVIFVKPHSERACEPEILFNLVENQRKSIVNSYEKAIDKSLEMNNNLIVITGTFFNDGIPNQYLEKKKTTF